MNSSSLKSVLFSRYGAGLVALLLVLVASLGSVFDSSRSKASPPAQIKEVAAVCNASNPGPFDGKVLYPCVFGQVVNRDWSLVDPEKHAAFVQKWQHRFDNGDMLSDEEHTYQALRMMVADLHEMHTAFLPPRATKDVYESAEGKLTGIGASLTRLNLRSARKALGDNPLAPDLADLHKIGAGTPLVVFPAPPAGSPAAKAGLLSGDHVVAIDGRSVYGMTLPEAVDYIKGTPGGSTASTAGTTVVLSVERPQVGGIVKQDISIVREEVHFPQVVTESMPGGIVKVRVLGFTKTVAADFTDALYQACTGKSLPEDTKELVAVVDSYKPERDCSVKGVVIDLRSNPGGVMEQAVLMGQAVIKDGTLISVLQRKGAEVIETRQRLAGDKLVTELVRDGKVVKSVSDKHYMRVLPQIPVVVLVNGMSASASEILAGMLQVNGAALVAGKPSFGKEVGQNVLPVDYGSAVKITTFRFLPGGKPLGPAVIPDMEVAQSDAYIDDPIHGEDVQMTGALALLGDYKNAFERAHSQAGINARAARAAEVATLHAKRDSLILGGSEIQVEQ